MRRLSLNGKIIGKTRKFSKDRRTSPLLTNLFRLTDYELIIVWKQHRLPRCRSPPLLKFDPMPYQISEESEEPILNKRYFRKKAPHRKAEEIEWIEMSGKEYYRFVRAPENRERWFIDMGNVVLECTEEEYRKYKAEDDHSNYIRAQGANWVLFSLSELGERCGCCDTELAPDDAEDVSEIVIRNIRNRALRRALCMLSEEEYHMIVLKYDPKHSMSEEKIGMLYGLSQSCISKRLKAIKIFLKKTVIEFEKNPQ